VSLPFELPPDVERVLRGRSSAQIGIGKSGAAVYRCDGVYLKTQKRNPHDVIYGDLRRELERLQWLAGRGVVPDVLAFAQNDTHDFLVTRALPGDNAVNVARDRIPALIDLMAEAFRTLHAKSLDTCPFDATADTLIAQAAMRLDAGSVDTDDFDLERRGRDPHELFAELLTLRPRTEDLVFTHGDLCLPNVILDGPRVTGYVDVGRAGIADRWRDIALCTRSVAGNWGPEWADAFIRAYGAGYDERALEFYRLLDEFF
jgi:kanamycin kinase/aminoglycoside 3'-phosphotransferase-2